MLLAKSRRVVATTASLVLLASLLAAGCTKKDEDASSSTSSTTTQGDAALIAAGEAVFKANDCGKCHAVAGQGGRMGPDLSKIGAESEHTSEWLVAHIKNPKSHNPKSRMPAFEGKISDKDLLALGAYLASLK